MQFLLTLIIASSIFSCYTMEHSAHDALDLKEEAVKVLEIVSKAIYQVPSFDISNLNQIFKDPLNFEKLCKYEPRIFYRTHDLILELISITKYMTKETIPLLKYWNQILSNPIVEKISCPALQDLRDKSQEVFMLPKQAVKKILKGRHKITNCFTGDRVWNYMKRNEKLEDIQNLYGSMDFKFFRNHFKENLRPILLDRVKQSKELSLCETFNVSLLKEKVKREYALYFNFLDPDQEIENEFIKTIEYIKQRDPSQEITFVTKMS